MVDIHEDTAMKYRFTVEGKVPSKKNSLVVGNRRVRTKQSVKDQNRYLMLQLKEQRWKKDKELFPIAHTISVSMVFTLKFRLMKRDVDNMATTMLDILEDAGIIEDDRFVMEIRAGKMQGDKESTEIIIKDYENS